MKSKNIFIHIPKTGGTTINCVMNKTQWQTTPDFNYRHILYETKRSNSGDIFNPLKYSEYEGLNIFMLLRNPIDRIISEYYFIKDRQEFMSLIKPVPKNLKEYIKNRQTNNYMIGFLLGKRMYDENLVTEDDLDLVINTIKNLDIKVGIFEHYEKSLIYFSSITGIKWPKNIDIKRITLNRPKLDTVSEEIKSLIKKHNALDYKLYEYGLQHFEEKIKAINNNQQINFKGNKYNYVLKYTERFNLLEIELENKKFIIDNSTFFNDLNLYLHKTLKLKDGKIYVQIWNDCLISTINNSYKNSSMANQLNAIDTEEPLNKTKQIANIIEVETKGKSSQHYNKKLVFNKNDINPKKYNKGLFSKLKSSLFK